MYHSKRLVSYATLPDGQIRASFADGSRVTCDLLIGADGIKSVVRENMLQQRAATHAAAGRYEAAYRCLLSNQPVWSGTMAYRALIPMEKVQKDIDKGDLSLEECHIQVCTPPLVALSGLAHRIHTQHVGKNAVSCSPLSSVDSLIYGSQNLIVYPVANGSMINFAAFYHQPSKVGTLFEGPWVSEGSKEELQAVYSNYESSVQTWVQVSDAQVLAS